MCITINQLQPDLPKKTPKKLVTAFFTNVCLTIKLATGNKVSYADIQSPIDIPVVSFEAPQINTAHEHSN